MKSVALSHPTYSMTEGGLAVDWTVSGHLHLEVALGQIYHITSDIGGICQTFHKVHIYWVNGATLSSVTPDMSYYTRTSRNVKGHQTQPCLHRFDAMNRRSFQQLLRAGV
jgi:hypothetical protein